MQGCNICFLLEIKYGTWMFDKPESTDCVGLNRGSNCFFAGALSISLKIAPAKLS